VSVAGWPASIVTACGCAVIAAGWLTVTVAVALGTWP
jgi:hypothetical protein